MRTFLIHGDDPQIGSLDAFVSAESPEQAVELWRKHMVKQEWLEPDEAARQQPISVSGLPALPMVPMVHDWDDVSLPEKEY